MNAHGAIPPTSPAHVGPGHNDPPTLPIGRWAFLDSYIEHWFSHLMFADVPSSTVADPRFDTFLVHLSSTTGTEGATSGRTLLYATELVAYMLALDKRAWWYAKRRPRPWFGAYDPSRYDPNDLVPKMTFTLNRVLQRSDDDLDAVKLLHPMLLENDTTSPEHDTYAIAKQRILEQEDPDRRLRGFQIPTQIRLQPPVPEHADQLRSYLRDVVVTVRAVMEKWTSDPAIPFRLDAVALNVYATFLSDVHVELRELLSLGVPVTISLRHNVTGGFIPDTLEWTANERANVYPVIAHDPGLVPARIDEGNGATLHTLDSKWISSSHELWSAVAYAPMLRKVRVQPTEFDNPVFNEQLARWMGFALAQSPSLRTLEIVRFRMTEEELDALEAVLTAPFPSSLRPSTPSNQQVELIRLIPTAVIECQPGGEINGYESDEAVKLSECLTLAELNVPTDWQFPVVQRFDASGKVELIVPGHAIGAVAQSSIASSRTASRIVHQDSKLTSLVIHNEVYDEGITARFVRLVGRGLRELRWYGEYLGSNGGLDLQGDLEEIAETCSDLEILAIEETQLTSLTMLSALSLRELSLLSTPVPMAALVEFFQLLADKTTPIAQWLQRFTYYCPQQPLTADVVDAVVTMVASNRRLYSVMVGVEDAIVVESRERVESVGAVPVTVETLPLATKLAFVSVVQHFHGLNKAQPLGQLDNGCVATVFHCLGRVAKRRVRFVDSRH